MITLFEPEFKDEHENINCKELFRDLIDEKCDIACKSEKVNTSTDFGGKEPIDYVKECCRGASSFGKWLDTVVNFQHSGT